MSERFNSAEILLFARSTSKLIARVIESYTKGKMSEEMFVKNLKLFKDAINKKMDKLLTTEPIFTETSDFDTLLLEFLEQKRIIPVKSKFLLNFEQVEKDLQNGNLEHLKDFVKQKKTLLKEANSDLEQRLQLQIFLNKLLYDSKQEAINFLREKSIDLQNMKFWVSILIDDEEMKQKKYKLHVRLVFEEYKRVLLFTKGLPIQSRLNNRLLVGILSINTIKCTDFGEENCPTCIPWMRTITRSLPNTKQENTFMICPGNKTKINDQNRPYLFSSRWVYSEKYLKQHGHVVYCQKTGKYLNVSPQNIYFL